MNYSEQSQQTILIVDDDPFNLNIVSYALQQADFEAKTAQSGEVALTILKTEGLPHLAIVDLHMPPGMNGFEFCRTIHQFSDLPVILLTAVDEEATVVEGLEEYAEDYITKPFKPGELVARVRSVLRRMGTFAFDLKATTRVDDRLEIDFPNRKALIYGQPTSLTPTETKLLYILMRSAGHTVNTDFILRRLWPNDTAFEDRLHVHLHRLRRKIEDKDKSRPRYIISERGLGYIFRATGEAYTAVSH
ncbi:MAG: response regulator transcription factor [Chloroflexi bacterium]|nr:response regulator transcription factor [Chloroflexota bacterium]